MVTRREWLCLAAGAAAGLNGIGARAQTQAPQFRNAERTRERIVAAIRAFDSAEPRKLPAVQKIEPVTDIAVAGVKARPDQLPLIDYFVGDLQLRYSFDDPSHLSSVSAADLRRLKLKREELPALSAANFRRLYPDFVVERLQPHLSSVTNAGELEPSLMLDAAFWNQERERAGAEIIAAVPARDSLVFSNRAVARNIDVLKAVTNDVYESAKKSALSRKLFLWTQGRWEVLA